ncbi:MAG: Pr6Pr family membrane protein [Clostridia bacterium]|nr:Pr6Pr family membrane protein [Clostridia bacterium]
MTIRAKYSLICKTALFCTALFALGLQCGMGDAFTFEPMQRFSMLYALLTAFYYLFALIAHSRSGQVAVWFPALKLTVTVSGILTCAVVVLMLPDPYAGLSRPECISLQMAHYLLPIGTLLDWLCFDPRGVLRLTDPFLALLPASLYTMLAWYSEYLGYSLSAPYWFLNRTALGTSTAWSIALGLAGGMLIVGYILYALDWLLDPGPGTKKKSGRKKSK